MTHEDALIRIAAVWVLWARQEIGEKEAMARIAEALEAVGLAPIQ